MLFSNNIQHLKMLSSFVGIFNPTRRPIGIWVCLDDLLRLLRFNHLSFYGFVDHQARYDPLLFAQSIIEWLCYMQDCLANGGVSAGYSLYSGVLPGYPETTGYIIPTFFEYAILTGKTEYQGRAIRMADWLLSLQMPSGAFPGGYATLVDDASIFNTGQILLGLTRAYRETSNRKYLAAAHQAASWLVQQQEPDGRWLHHTYEGRCHVYHTMVDWALAAMFQITGDRRYRDAAIRNLDWALSVQEPNGWFRQLGLGNRPSYLHFIGYTLQGLVEAGAILEQRQYLDAALVTAQQLLAVFVRQKWLPGHFKSDWSSDAHYSCLTGNAQIAVVWQQLYMHFEDEQFYKAATGMNRCLMSRIRLRGPHSIRGAISGSAPIWGRYQPLKFPNWAAKFTVDSLLTEVSLASSTKGGDQDE